MASESERQFLDEVGSELSAEDRELLPRIPVACLVRAAVRFVRCGVQNGECQRAFLGDVLECFGVGGDRGGAAPADAGGGAGGGV